MASVPIEAEETGIEIGVLNDLTGYHLRRAWGAFGGHLSQTLSGTDMRQIPFAILSVIDANPGINQGAAGRVLGIQRANMVALINDLVSYGWIERKVVAKNRRAFALTMTPLGKKKFASCHKRIVAHEKEMLSDLTAPERVQLTTLLLKIEAKER